jgi:hypothetical protein
MNNVKQRTKAAGGSIEITLPATAEQLASSHPDASGGTGSGSQLS